LLDKRFLIGALLLSSLIGAGAFAQSPPVSEVSKAPIFPGKGKEADWKKAIKLYQEGVSLGSSGSLSDAITDIKSAIEIYPFEPVFYNGLAVEYYQRHQAGDFPLAEKALRKALTMKPKSAMLWDNLGKGLFEQKQYAKAKEALTNALHCNPPAAKAKELQTNIDTIDQLMKNGNKPVAAS
jgi:Tfp pilus assembly protein PilF